MMRSLVFVFVLICTCEVLEAFDPPHEFDCGPLCDYNRKDDGYYEYYQLTSYPQDGFTTYMLNMTSQKWMDYDFMDRPIWWHYVAIHIPDDLQYTEQALVYVGSSNNDAGIPGPNSGHIRQTGLWTQRTGMITSVIRQVPNQPIRFNGTLRYRYEDSIIAYTWKQYLIAEEGTQDPEVVLRMPMTKAVVKAMDTVIDFAKKTNGADIKRFMIAGESKRGWTTWMMPPVDSRVEVISPIVLSCLNMMELFMHYYESLGAWPFAIGDYWLADIMSYMGHPKGYELMDIVDPYSEFYRPALNIPKLMISGAKDEFFFLDDYDYFFDGLPGEKYIWLQENTAHSVNSGPLQDDHWRMLETFYVAFIKNKPRPKFTFQRHVTSLGASILMHTTEEVSKVTGWSAVTPDMVFPRRDFRNYVLNPIIPRESGVVYYEKEATDLGNGFWEIYYDNPPPGKYLAFYMKMHFPWASEGREFIFTTKAQIIPEGFPFEPCDGPGILGTGCRSILT